MQELHSYNTSLKNYLTQQKNSKKKSYAVINPWGEIATEKLFSFATKGKLLRGTMTLHLYKFLSNNDFAKALPSAACMELTQAALLIHDDIMDNDDLRRGEPTVLKYFENYLAEKGILEKKAAENIAICIGDLAFFIAMEELSIYPQSVLQKVTREISLVTLGQMQDIAHEGEITQETILQLYRYKTARYSFSLPFAIAGILAKKSNVTIQRLELLGETLGILFQIQDDLLDIFGTAEKIGKPIGSDIRANKMTLLKALLSQVSENKIQKEILPLFGKATITNEELLKIKAALTTYGVLDQVEGIKKQLGENAKKQIDELTSSVKQKQFFYDLLNYLQKRDY